MRDSPRTVITSLHPVEFQTGLRKLCPNYSRNRWIKWLALALAAIELGAIAGCSHVHTPGDQAAEEIRRRIVTAGIPARIAVGSDSVFSIDLVSLFYENRSYRLAWSTSDGMVKESDSLIKALREADREGLRPQEYHLVAIESVIVELNEPRDAKAAIKPERRADLDLLLTDAFLIYASHLSQGRIDQETMTLRSFVERKETRYTSLLEQSLQSHRVNEYLRILSPGHKMYSDLRGVLASLVTISGRGGWGMIGSGPTMKAGDEGRSILALKNRLRISGDFAPRRGVWSDKFDSTLVESVRVFQKRHGIDAGGTVDSVTLAVLNVPVVKRIEQVILTMERWRWMPHDLGETHIRINIPDFRLVVVDKEREVVNMEVVLGLPGWQTPVFSASMTQVLFNSHWMAPEDIVERELINYMKADSNYLRSNNMTLWRGNGDSLALVDPRSIDWPAVNDKNIDFRLRQEPGPQNIMGQVKFLVPNKYNIYLHDTPYREDFPKAVRMFSHGCIRLERPLDLAEFVLRDYPGWTRAKIDTVVARIVEQSLLLKSPIPVHILYATVWKERDGSIQFRDDFYGLDRKLAAALCTTPFKNMKESGGTSHSRPSPSR